MLRFLTIFLLPIGGFLLVSCGPEKDSADSDSGDSAPVEDYSPYHNITDAAFVGAENCRTCHEKEFDDWLGSDHHKAMNPATEEFVLGDFDNVEFDHFGQVFRFFRKGEEFWVNAPDADGERKAMMVEYTFGHEPLQQYLIPLPGGRYQALQVCWDSRPESEGGQRWFHLYPDEPVPPDDVLHWTRRHFNWNYMCADCHSTNLQKNFDAETLTYDTTWSEMNVSCEACHGPGSAHVEWAEAENAVVKKEFAELADYVESKGLVVTLKEPEEAGWAIDPETNQPKRTTPLASNVQVEACARCHSHRQLMEPVFRAGESFHDTHVPSVISDQLYHHDGQIDEEVYVYGSFVQSKMYHAGVRCTDCHDPHTSKLVAQGNALCLQCHQAEPYNTPAHHFHPVDSTGASCVECHMPHKAFMVVDDRRDHSLRVPRPDLAAELGTPDACTQCHTDQTREWATEAFKEWWGSAPRNAHYGEILSEARQGEPGSLERLIALANDLDRPAIVRAAAVETLGQQLPDAESARVVAARLGDPEPAVRIQALAALQSYPPEQRLEMAADLLDDPVRSVRAEAARVLAAANARFTPEQEAAFERAAAEFLAKQEAISDRAAGHMGRALFYADLGKVDDAEAAYRLATKVEPESVPARVNLAELLLEGNRPEEAEKEFRAAVESAMAENEEGLARDALARFLIRMKRYDEGVEELKLATELMPNHARTQYFYGVALNSLGQFEEAIPYLEKAHALDPYNLEYLTGLAAIFRDGGLTERSLEYARAALRLQPENPQLQQLVRSLGG
ncbi:MAG: tetratricopeptide repeat protein [Verrucomicrobiales bacterium]